MDADTGRIYDEEMMKQMTFRERRSLVPFEEGEIVELKGCKFRVRYVKPSPDNTVLLVGIPSKTVLDELVDKIDNQKERVG